MTDRDTTAADEQVARLLRETMRRHEHLAAGAGPRLLAAVRTDIASTDGRERPRRVLGMPRSIAAAAAVVVAVAAVPVGIALLGGDGPATGPTVTYSAAAPGTLPDGWRWESSLGLVVAVPDSWTVNDFGCNQTDAPTVARGDGPQEECLTPEPLTKEVVAFARLDGAVAEETLLEWASLSPGAARADMTVDGVPIIRYTGPVAGDRSGAAVLVLDRGVALFVRTRSDQTTAAILASLWIPSDVDNVGCPVRRPDLSPPAGTGGTLVDPQPVAVSLCYYGQSDRGGGRAELLSSGELTGTAAVQLAGLVNAAAPGGNPDRPTTECVSPLPVPDAVLLVRTATSTVDRVWVTWSGCVRRGLSNGAIPAHITRSIVAAIMNPLQVGYGFSGDLPD